MIDLSKLTLGEVSLIEELSGQAISSIGESDAPKGKAMAAIAMIVKRRSGEPTFTFNAALGMPMDEVNALLGVDEDGEQVEDPDSEEGKGSSSAKKEKPSKPSS